LNPSVRPESHQIVARCPACGAYESAEADTLAEPAGMVCRECGETWSIGDLGLKPDDALPDEAMVAESRNRPRGEVLVAEKRALVTYTNSRDDAWAGKIAGDYWPEPPRHSRLPMIAAAMAAGLFLAAFFGGRQAAVAALPDLAGLYAAIGLPVNLEGFAIEAVQVERAPTFAGDRLTVHASIRNLGRTDATMPSLAAVLYTSALVPAGAYSFDPPTVPIPAGGSLPLVMQLEGAPKEAAEVVVRFRRRGETLAVAGAAEPLAP